MDEQGRIRSAYKSGPKPSEQLHPPEQNFSLPQQPLGVVVSSNNYFHMANEDKRARFEHCIESSGAVGRLGNAIAALYQMKTQVDNPLDVIKTSLTEQSSGDSRQLQREVSDLKSRNQDLERKLEELRKEATSLGRKPSPAAKKKAGKK